MNNKWELKMKLLPTNTKLGEESKQQLTELGNKLKPYLKAYQESRGAIAHINTHCQHI